MKSLRPALDFSKWLVIFPALTVLPVTPPAEGGEPPKPAAQPAAAKTAAKPAEKPLAERPITTDQGPIGKLLLKWHAEGTAAGNVGDWYDNRDRGHSDLNMAPYPQLQRYVYPEEALKYRIDWAAQRAVMPMVVVGNSSTSAGVHNGGSNPRMMYSHPQGLRILYLQYTANNVYIYPEHCDYKPGHNGTPGFGDLYPTNTPYLFISQGSSGSDQPFMQAIPYTMAAFRPEVKKKLVDSGLLMPTIQMIFRTTIKRLADAKEYLTGKAHPPVYEGGWVDALKMVEMAHEIKADNIPPMVQLNVVEGDVPQCGRDFFEEDGNENLASTSAVIARLGRGRNHVHRLVVSAAESYDRNDRPLTFHWVVLRGDASKIQFKPKDGKSSVMEILVPWHDRRPVAEGSPMESNRVDIGVFVNNGAYYSAPGFVTFLFFDNEARTYDDAGRALEIGYGAGDTEVQVANWQALLDLLRPEATAAGAALLKPAFSKEETAVLLAAADEYRGRHAALEAARQKKTEAEKQKKPEAELKPLRQAEEAAAKAEEETFNKKRDGLKKPLRESLVAALAELVQSSTFYPQHAQQIAPLVQDAGRKAALADARRRLVAWGLLKEGPEGSWTLEGVRGAGADPARLTRFEKLLVERFNGELLGRLFFPGVVNFNARTYYVDPQLSAPKSWRDVYRYDAQGNVTGWTRYDGQQRTEFTADGLMVLEKDARGRPSKARTVRYEQDKPKGEPRHRFFAPNWSPLHVVPTDVVAYYEYAGDGDLRGRIAKRETEKPKK